MLTNQVSSKLQALRLSGMLKGLEEQEAMPNISQLNFNERFELLLDREANLGAGSARKKG